MVFKLYDGIAQVTFYHFKSTHLYVLENRCQY
jgi:hypothetical protein